MGMRESDSSRREQKCKDHEDAHDGCGRILAFLN
jgi:hypothetical protein